MKAVLFPGNSAATLVALDRPAVTADGVVIRLTMSGVCGTDVHYWHETPEQRGDRRPVVPGHEVVGVIEECGAGVTGLVPGDRVVVGMLHIGCGRCRHCVAGHHTYCPDKVIIGRNLHGSYGEFVAAPARAVHRLPDELGDEIAVLVACNLSTSWAAFRKTLLRAGERLIVFGLGGVGLSALLVAVHAGVEVIGIDPVASRRDAARGLGATRTFAPEEFSAVLRDDRGSVVAEATVECSGHPTAQQHALDALGPGGKMVIVAAGKGFEINPARLLGREITIQGPSVCAAPEFHQALAFAAAHQDELAVLLGPRFTIEQAEEALRHAAGTRDGKPLFTW